MPNEKDRLKDTLRKKQKAEEDRYFAEREKAALERLKKQLTPEQQKDVIALALNHCPRCGKPLVQEDQLGVTVDRCPERHGIWLDEGELEVIAEREGDSWLGRLFPRPRR